MSSEEKIAVREKSVLCEAEDYLELSKKSTSKKSLE